MQGGPVPVSQVICPKRKNLAHNTRSLVILSPFLDWQNNFSGYLSLRT